eukprot:1136455-Pelagomonas_calceolata.AAC.2
MWLTVESVSPALCMTETDSGMQTFPLYFLKAHHENQHRAPAKQGVKRGREGLLHQPHSKQPVYGHNLGDPGVDQWAAVRQLFPDHSACSHQHPQPLGKRGHTNLEFHDHQCSSATSPSSATANCALSVASHALNCV